MGDPSVPFNSLVAASNSWLKLHEWAAIGLRARRAAAKMLGKRTGILPPRRGDMIALGFGGSLNRDATVLIGCRISDMCWSSWCPTSHTGPGAGALDERQPICSRRA